MNIIRNGSQASELGSPDYFTGQVRADPLYNANSPSRGFGASVTFEPGARTAWHSHPLGQILIITAGRGLVQRWNGPVEEIHTGDVVWFGANEKHWHGAVHHTAMTHISIVENHNGHATDWMEKVSNEQYLQE